VFGKGEDASFQDLTIEAAKTPQEMESQGQTGSTTEKSEQGFLQQLPFVETTDAIAKSLGLPQSTEVEALARDVIREGGLFRSRGQQLSVSTFQSPAVTFAYERGWRQSFASSGFPGPDKEFELAQGFLAETSKDGQGTLLDASCGSGLFSRRFAASGAYKAVVALDYSASMLRQVDDFSRKEFGDNYSSSTEAGGKSLSLVRADIGRLPFASCSLDGVHASAAIHCWPAPDNAVAEIARVLKPGGVLVMSTFMPRSPLNVANRDNGGAYTFWSQEDLRSITRRCGLVDFEAVEREPAFIMVRVRKPAAK
jgi:SAM-dependent methyltransferase